MPTLAAAPPPPVAVRPRSRVIGLTVDQYMFLLRSGRMPERSGVELIDGQIVRTDRSRRGGDPTMIGEEHAWVVTRLGKLVIDLVGTGVSIRCQQPIALPPRHMPEPDGVIVRGDENDYVDRHPRPADVLCVIEVSDSSLEEDRTVKRRVYAEAGLTPYLIVNIPDRQVEWHDGPQPDGTYADVRVVGRGGVLAVPIGDGRTLAVAADRLIPPGVPPVT